LYNPWAYWLNSFEILFQIRWHNKTNIYVYIYIYMYSLHDSKISMLMEMEARSVPAAVYPISASGSSIVPWPRRPRLK
jgi:hypothetical protein